MDFVFSDKPPCDPALKRFNATSSNIEKQNFYFESRQSDHVIEVSMKGFGLMVINATFNNISVLSWRSVLLVEETGVPGEYHRPVASH
jgi:hypothetical protein